MRPRNKVRDAVLSLVLTSLIGALAALAFTLT